MKNTLEYKGYLGTVEYSNEDNCLYGKIIGIDDLVNYEAQSVEELNNYFKESVKDYLATCKEINKEPNKTFKGVFNVRTSKDNHRALSIIAEKHKMKLNEVINKAFDFFITNEDKILN
jgi:predicted HicB family RNase H-like nuclease